MPYLSLLLAVAGYLAGPPHPGRHQAPTPSRVLWIGARGCVFYTLDGHLRALPLTDEYRLKGPDDVGHFFNEYPFQAVRAGDWAYVRINHVRGRAVCSGVSILARPGGRVPPPGRRPRGCAVPRRAERRQR